MPHSVETVVYTLDELSETAKARARAWYRETCLDCAWYEAVFAHFETVCRPLGVQLRTRPVPLMGGGTRDAPHLYFHGFGFQGDGACFEGTFAHARGAPAAIRAHAPEDRALHHIADALQAVQRRNFYQLRAEVRHRGHHCHAYCMAITVERDSPTGQAMTDDAEDTVAEALRALARWLYRALRHEHAHLTADATVDETIVRNGWTFTADGAPFG
ncbi:MAG: hypothetical protein OXC65_01530 [Thiotrichales bacterium]|nr:hypothetical protein [Thiotrichales bacterium]